MRTIWIVVFLTGSVFAADATIDPLLKKMIDYNPAPEDRSYNDQYWKKHAELIKAFDELARRNGSTKYKLTRTTPPGPDKTEKIGDQTVTTSQMDPLDACRVYSEVIKAEGKQYVVAVFSNASCMIPGINDETVLLFTADGKYLDEAGAQ